MNTDFHHNSCIGISKNVGQDWTRLGKSQIIGLDPCENHVKGLIDKGLGDEPRYPTLKGIMQAKKKEITSMTPSDLGFRAEEMGWQGSRIVPNRLSVPEKKKRTVMLEGSEEEMVRDLVERLRREAKVL